MYTYSVPNMQPEHLVRFSQASVNSAKRFLQHVDCPFPAACQIFVGYIELGCR